MVGDEDDSVMLSELASHQHVIGILDFLSESGCNMALLMRFIPAQRADLDSALGLIAAHGLLETGDHGSWDGPGALRLTDRGESVARSLANRTVDTIARNDELLAGHRSPFGRAIDRVVNLWRHRLTGSPTTSRA